MRQMKIVWNSTGDCLELEPTNHEFAAYWIASLDQSQSNEFNLKHSYFDPNWPSALNTHILTIDNWLCSKLKITELSAFRDQDVLDQSVLNALHRTWISIIHDHPKLVTLLSHNKELCFHWDQINKKIHAIEDGFKSLYTTKQYWETPNIFGTSVLDFNVCHVKIMFSQKGRSTFNKWRMLDYNLLDRDTNDYVDVGAEVTINLTKQRTYSPPQEYVEFCKLHGVPVVGDTLNLANFCDYETKLTEIRNVYLRNIVHENNTASFKF